MCLTSPTKTGFNLPSFRCISIYPSHTINTGIELLGDGSALQGMFNDSVNRCFNERLLLLISCVNVFDGEY